MPLYSIYALRGQHLWREPFESASAMVAAASQEQARACMTHGSDCCWEGVFSCRLAEQREISGEELARCYSNCGAWVVGE